jgi:hypothetical protein
MAVPKFLTGLRANNKRIQDVADPTAATDAATKQYVDQMFVGINDLKEPVRGTTTGNLAITALVNGLVHDGVTYATGDRILLKNQTTGAENGIYVIGASGTGTRSTDADASTEVTRGFAVTVMEGTTKGTGASQANPITYIITNTGAITVGTTALTFAPVGAGAGTTYTADGQGIELGGTTFSIELDGSTLEKSASGLKVSDAARRRTFAANCVATTNPQTFAHGLGSADVVVQVKEGTDFVFPDVTVDATNITVDWGGAPSAAQYRVLGTLI